MLKKAIITGATGSIGPALIECLLKNEEFSENYELKNIKVKGHIISYYQVNRKIDLSNNSIISIYNIVDYQSLEQIGLFDNENEFYKIQNDFF